MSTSTLARALPSNLPINFNDQPPSQTSFLPPKLTISLSEAQLSTTPSNPLSAPHERDSSWLGSWTTGIGLSKPRTRDRVNSLNGAVVIADLRDRPKAGILLKFVPLARFDLHSLIQTLPLLSHLRLHPLHIFTNFNSQSCYLRCFAPALASSTAPFNVWPHIPTTTPTYIQTLLFRNLLSCFPHC